MDPSDISKEEALKYKDAVISHIKRGKGPRFCQTYAHIHAANGELLVSATLEYCVERMIAASYHYCDAK